MELRTLRYFLAVAKEQSITHAAESLHLTQPNLSRQLKELEDELGTSLFHRGRRVTLTEEGLILRKRAQEIMELLDKAKSEITASIESVGGNVSIGCAETDAMRILMQAMKTLRTTHPDIHFHITSGHEEVVAERLDRGLLDFGVFMEPTDMQKYDFIQLPAADTWGILMRKDDPLAEHISITPKDLMTLPLISSNQVLFQNQFSGWLGGTDKRVNIIATYNLLFNASLMVEEGIGYALCLDRIIPTTADRPLCFRPLEPKVEAGICIGWKKYSKFSKASELFLDTLHQVVHELRESETAEPL
ncbi:MAG: LysR family transcriptional regulator [Oscillospiraceae bacterium]|nr:LysR family transcriptional regulator [Oscillospiraceae bacterium]